MLRALLTACALLVAVPAAAAPDLGPETVEPVKLNGSITVGQTGVRLSDLFAGVTAHGDKIVARAPRPGQRSVLTTETLSAIARTYGVEWQPREGGERAVIYRPGLTLTPDDVLAAIKSDLVVKGMPERMGLRAITPLPTLIVPAEAASPVTVRDAVFDAATKTFSAIAEVADGDRPSRFLQVRGTGFLTVTVPVLKEDAGRTAVITGDMIAAQDVPEELVREDIVTDAALLIGKSPRGYLRAGRPIRDGEVARVTLVDVPVLRTELRRDGVIHESHVVWKTMNADQLPADVVMDPAYLIGKAPRSIVVANVPLRRSEVVALREITMAVAVRDLMRGEAITEDDVNWVSVQDNQAAFGVIQDQGDLVGRVADRSIRAGQAIKTSDVKRPILITRGKIVTMVYETGAMKLTVQGQALEQGGEAQAIRVANAKTKTAVLAEVIDASTVRVLAQQSAMQ